MANRKTRYPTATVTGACSGGDWCKNAHALHVKTDSVELTVVRGGKLAYLHIELRDDGVTSCATVEGAPALRALAEAILAEVDGAKPKAKRRGRKAGA